jgi:hypothetical protein
MVKINCGGCSDSADLSKRLSILFQVSAPVAVPSKYLQFHSFVQSMLGLLFQSTFSSPLKLHLRHWSRTALRHPRNLTVASDFGVMQKLDSDGSGRLDCREFCNAIKKLVNTEGQRFVERRGTFDLESLKEIYNSMI